MVLQQQDTLNQTNDSLQGVFECKAVWVKEDILCGTLLLLVMTL